MLSKNAAYLEARCQGVIRSALANKNQTFDDWITADSPEWQKQAVIQLTRYWAMETGGSQVITTAFCEWDKYQRQVCPITEWFSCKDGQDRLGLIGFITFVEGLYLAECYLHPLFRGSGYYYMRDAWEKSCDRFPTFDIMSPISKAMQYFLEKNDPKEEHCKWRHHIWVPADSPC